MRTRARTMTATALVALALTLTACDNEKEPSTGDKGQATAEASKAPSISVSDMAKARGAAGYPPESEAAAGAAFIKALNAINLDIVHGKDEKALNRGSDTCRILKTHSDRAD